jgi:hypothetical protein
MKTHQPLLRSYPELRDYVYQTLCEYHELLPDAFQTSEKILRVNSRTHCGIWFCLHGPRSVKLTAIWEKKKNRILFYGPTGKRFLQVKLEQDPLVEWKPEPAGMQLAAA